MVTGLLSLSSPHHHGHWIAFTLVSASSWSLACFHSPVRNIMATGHSWPLVILSLSSQHHGHWSYFHPTLCNITFTQLSLILHTATSRSLSLLHPHLSNIMVTRLLSLHHSTIMVTTLGLLSPSSQRHHGHWAYFHPHHSNIMVIGLTFTSVPYHLSNIMVTWPTFTLLTVPNMSLSLLSHSSQQHHHVTEAHVNLYSMSITLSQMSSTFSSVSITLLNCICIISSLLGYVPPLDNPLMHFVPPPLPTPPTLPPPPEKPLGEAEIPNYNLVEELLLRLHDYENFCKGRGSTK
jgi:hypothetical protein